MLPITQTFISNTRNRPGTKLIELKGLIIHWTANTGRGSDADNHFRYFENNAVSASAHFFVDDHQIVQIMPEDEVAYHVGARSYRYTDTARSIMGTGSSPNHYLIGIEMCVNIEGDWDKTYKHTIELAQHLMAKYNLGIEQVWRHFDITGKDCPKMMVNAEDEAWGRFLAVLKTSNYPNESTAIAEGVVNVSGLSVRTGNATFFRKTDTLALGANVTIYESMGTWYRIGQGMWVAKKFVTAQTANNSNKHEGLVNVNSLNVRSGPSTYFSKVSSLKLNDKVTIHSEEGSWYHIGDNKWVHKNFIEVSGKIARQGIVIAETLNIRRGAGTNQSIAGSVAKDEVVSILEERNGWFRIGDSEWVYAIYVTEKLRIKGKVIANSLNVRSGPGTSFGKVKAILRNDIVQIEAEEGDWYRIGKNLWVYSEYIIKDEI